MATTTPAESGEGPTSTFILQLSGTNVWRISLGMASPTRRGLGRISESDKNLCRLIASLTELLMDTSVLDSRNKSFVWSRHEHLRAP